LAKSGYTVPELVSSLANDGFIVNNALAESVQRFGLITGIVLTSPAGNSYHKLGTKLDVI